MGKERDLVDWASVRALAGGLDLLDLRNEAAANLWAPDSTAWQDWMREHYGGGWTALSVETKAEAVVALRKEAGLQ